MPSTYRLDESKPSISPPAQFNPVSEQPKPVGFSKNNNNAIYVVEDYEDGRKF